LGQLEYFIIPGGIRAAAPARAASRSARCPRGGAPVHRPGARPVNCYVQGGVMAISVTCPPCPVTSNDEPISTNGVAGSGDVISLVDLKGASTWHFSVYQRKLAFDRRGNMTLYGHGSWRSPSG